MADEDHHEVPEGAAVLPVIPPEVGAHPLLLAVLHAIVFIAGSDEKIIDPEAAQEALERLAGYVQRLEKRELERVRADLVCLAEYARQQQWPGHEVEFFASFLEEFGVGGGHDQ